MKPKLKFAISPEADIENAKWFVKNGEFVDRFLPRDLYFIIDKKFIQREKNIIISKYTENFYKTNTKSIAAGMALTKKRWTKIENEFYRLVDQILQNYPWPKGKYIGYASIFSMFPRDIKEKVFYFPYSRKNWDPISTIAHEMLHFIFYDYIQKKYGLTENSKLKGKNPKYLWRLSEAFNTVIENWKPYKDIFRVKKNIKPYPECENIYKAMVGQWRKNQDIGDLLDKWLQL